MASFFYKDSELQMDSNLILCIEEHDPDLDQDSVDTRLFIGWNNLDNDYFIRGKRENIYSKDFVPYAFHCDSTDELYDFIEFVVGKQRKTSIILYNYNNINGYTDFKLKADDLTYDFFEKYMDRNYEIAAYDGINLRRREIKKYLRLLKNMYNWDKYK